MSLPIKHDLLRFTILIIAEIQELYIQSIDSTQDGSFQITLLLCRNLPPCPSSPLQLEVVVLFYTVPYMNGGRVLDILQSTGWSENFKNLDFIAQDLIPFLFTTLCWQKRSNFYSDMLHLICVLNSSLVTVALSGCVWITLISSTITSKLSLKRVRRACSYLMFCEAYPHSCWTQNICIFALLQLIFLRDLFCISPATFSTIYLTTKWK